MSEPQITHSAEPTTDLRGTIQAVLERHHEAGQLYGHAICGNCRQLWPCESHTLATALIEAVGKLEAVERDTYGDWESDPYAWMDGIRESAQSALTTIAAKLKESDDAR